MALTLTILGAGPSAPNPGGANSGYLLRQGDTAVVVDCGPGCAGRLIEHIAANRLAGVAISHFHPDHYFDLVALYYLLKFGAPRTSHLQVWIPPGGREFLDRFGRVVGHGKPHMLEDVLDLCEYAAGRVTVIGDLHFTFHPVQHYILSHAMRVQSASGAVFVFSSDVAPCPQLAEAARGADLFMCESALLDVAHDEKDPARRGHMTAREAGVAARDAAVKRLLITHYRSGPEADVHHIASAREAYKGSIELAREGQTYTVG